MTIIIPESIKIVFFVLLFWFVYGFISDDDYHKKFDKQQPVMYNCDIAIESPRPGTPQYVIDECKKMKGMNVNTN
jgi:hypothetical protein